MNVTAQAHARESGRASNGFTYEMSLEEMLLAGHYQDTRLQDILTRYPHTIQRCKEEVLLPRIHNFGRPISPYEAMKEMDKLGLRAATFAELLHFGATMCHSRPEIHEQVVLALDPGEWVCSTILRYIPSLVYWGDMGWSISLCQFKWHAMQLAQCSYAVLDKR